MKMNKIILAKMSAVQKMKQNVFLTNVIDQMLKYMVAEFNYNIAKALGLLELIASYLENHFSQIPNLYFEVKYPVKSLADPNLDVILIKRVNDFEIDRLSIKYYVNITEHFRHGKIIDVSDKEEDMYSPVTVYTMVKLNERSVVLDSRYIYTINLIADDLDNDLNEIMGKTDVLKCIGTFGTYSWDEVKIIWKQIYSFLNKSGPFINDSYTEAVPIELNSDFFTKELRSILRDGDSFLAIMRYDQIERKAELIQTYEL